jgi:hypothetical protein
MRLALITFCCLIYAPAWSSGHTELCRASLYSATGQQSREFIGEDETWLAACEAATAQCLASKTDPSLICFNEIETDAILRAGHSVTLMAERILDTDGSITVLPNQSGYRVTVDFSDCVTRLEYDAAGTLIRQSRRRCD